MTKGVTGGPVVKDPDADLDYGLEWHDWMPEDDSIVASSWLVFGPDELLVVGSTSVDDLITTVWLSGGTRYRQYVVTNRIITAAGRKDDRSIVFVIDDK